MPILPVGGRTSSGQQWCNSTFANITWWQDRLRCSRGCRGCFIRRMLQVRAGNSSTLSSAAFYLADQARITEIMTLAMTSRAFKQMSFVVNNVFIMGISSDEVQAGAAAASWSSTSQVASLFALLSLQMIVITGRALVARLPERAEQWRFWQPSWWLRQRWQHLRQRRWRLRDWRWRLRVWQR